MASLQIDQVKDMMTPGIIQPTNNDQTTYQAHWREA